MINTMEINPEELPALDLFQNCRLCLAKEKVSVDIFSEGHEIRLLYYKIVSCLPVNVTQEDKLPRKICAQCNQKVDDFYQFWTLTARSQKTLLEWVEKRELLPPSKIKTENDVPGQVSFKQEAMDYSDDDNDLDRYDDDNSEEENNVQPRAVVKVCEDGEETASGATAAGPSTATIKLYTETIKEEMSENGTSTILVVNSKDLIAAYSEDNWDGQRCLSCGNSFESPTWSYIHYLQCRKRKQLKYMCSHATCKNIYKTNNDYRNHLKYKHKVSLNRFRPKTGNYQCNTCFKKFRIKRSLIEHVLGHINIKPYTCDYCDEQFITLKTFHHHVYRKHVERKKTKYFFCHVCTKLFKTREERDMHKAQHHVGEERNYHFQCHHCNKTYCSKTSIYNHIKTIHLKSEEEKKKNQAVCDICGKGYIRANALSTHIKQVHDGTAKKQCKVCGKKLYDKRALENHMSIHTGVKGHCCNFCGRSFSSRTYLRVHMFSHTGEAPHVCHLCPQRFRQRSSYTSHYKTHHPGVVPPKLKYTLNELNLNHNIEREVN